MKTQWEIRDWTNKLCFFGKKFKSFDDAEYFLSVKLGNDYESDRQEYYIKEVSNEN